MLSITDNFLYVIDAGGHQQIFDADKLKTSLLKAFEASGNPNGYLAEDIACAVESAMAESARAERIFTQSEVDAAVTRTLENAGCAAVAAFFRRSNSHLYITLDANILDANMLISRHLGIQEPAVSKLSRQVVDALQKLNIKSASPALYLELARHYEQTLSGHLPAASAALSADNHPNSGNGKFLLSSAEASSLMPPGGRVWLKNSVITLANVSRVYPNFRLTLDLCALADKLKLTSPVTELDLAPELYNAGEKTGLWLNLLCRHLNMEALPLYLVLDKLDEFAVRYLGTTYPEGRLTALDTAAFFRNALGYPVKKVRCRTTPGARNAN